MLPLFSCAAVINAFFSARRRETKERIFRRLIFGAAFVILLSPSLANAQTTIAVNDTAQGPTAQNPTGQGDTTCTLGDAILTANSLALSGAAVGGCQPAGNGAPYTIQLATSATYSLTSVHNYWYGPNALPPIATQIVIEGNGATLQVPANDLSGNPIKRLRFFYVGAGPNAPATLNIITPGAGNLALKNLTLTGGRQVGGTGGSISGGGAGMGGAIFNQGTLQIVNTTLTANSATGGESDGSSPNGGGGMGQDSAQNRLGEGYIGGGFGGALTSSTGGVFTAISKGGVAGSGQSGGGGGFGGTDNGNSSTGTGGGVPDGLGGGADASNAGHGSGGGAIYFMSDCRANYGGDFGAGGTGCGGGGVGGGGGSDWPNSLAAGGGGFGGGGAGGSDGASGGFGGGSASTIATGYGGSTRGGGAGMGGAIFNHGGNLTVLNSTLSGNSTIGGTSTNAGNGGGSGLGGAIFNLNGAVTVSFSTLDANSVLQGSSPDIQSSAAGGAIYSVGYNLVAGQAATLLIRNSILADTVGGSDLASDQPSNIARGAGGGVNAATASVTFAGVNIIPSASYTGAGTINGPTPLTSSPQLGPLEVNAPGLTPTMAIPASSPAFQVTPCDPAVTTDQRGVARPQPGVTACDAGAYELQTQSITFNPIAQQVVGAVVTLSATASSSLLVTFQSQTLAVCSVSGSSATMIAVGTCKIEADQAGNTNYAPAKPVTQSFSVVAAPSFTIKPLPTSETVNRGDVAGFVLELDSVNSFKGKVKLSCSGGPSGSVCVDLPQTVTLNGRAFALAGIFFPKNTKPGTYIITFTGVSGSLTNSTTATVTLK